MLIPAAYGVDRAGRAGYLELSKGEATAESGLHVVLLSGATDNGSQKTSGGSGGDGSSDLLAVHSAGLLLSGLVEPGLDAVLPILVEVSINQNVVVLDHFLDSITTGDQ